MKVVGKGIKWFGSHTWKITRTSPPLWIYTQVDMDFVILRRIKSTCVVEFISNKFDTAANWFCDFIVYSIMIRERPFKTVLILIPDLTWAFITFLAKILNCCGSEKTVIIWLNTIFAYTFPWNHDVFVPNFPAFDREGEVKQKNFHKIMFPTSTCTCHGIMLLPFSKTFISTSSYIILRVIECLKLVTDRGSTQRQKVFSHSTLGSLVWKREWGRVVNPKYGEKRPHGWNKIKQWNHSFQIFEINPNFHILCLGGGGNQCTQVLPLINISSQLFFAFNSWKTYAKLHTCRWLWDFRRASWSHNLGTAWDSWQTGKLTCITILLCTYVINPFTSLCY